MDDPLEQLRAALTLPASVPPGAEDPPRPHGEPKASDGDGVKAEEDAVRALTPATADAHLEPGHVVWWRSAKLHGLGQVLEAGPLVVIRPWLPVASNRVTVHRTAVTPLPALTAALDALRLSLGGPQ